MNEKFCLENSDFNDEQKKWILEWFAYKIYLFIKHYDTIFNNETKKLFEINLNEKKIISDYFYCFKKEKEYSFKNIDEIEDILENLLINEARAIVDNEVDELKNIVFTTVHGRKNEFD